MTETFGLPALRGRLTHDEAISTLRDLVNAAAQTTNNDSGPRMCGRDIAAYINELETKAKLADQRLADVNRKLDEILDRLRRVTP